MEVEWEDQQKIAEFSKLDGRLAAIQNGEKLFRQQKEDLEDLELEIELVDEDEKLLYRVGDAFVYLKQSQIVDQLAESKEQVDAQLETSAADSAKLQGRLDELKAALYAKFGKDNINLERD